MSKVSIIIVSGSREKIRFAAMMASVAAVGDLKVTVFISMNALLHFVTGESAEVPNEGRMGKLMAEKNVPEFLGLFEQAVELGDADSVVAQIKSYDLAEIEDYIDPYGCIMAGDVPPVWLERKKGRR